MAKKSEVSGQKSKVSAVNEVRIRRTNGGAFVSKVEEHAGGRTFHFGADTEKVFFPLEVAARLVRFAPNLEIVED